MAGRTDFLRNLSDTNGASLGAALADTLPVNEMGPYPMARDVPFPGTTQQGELLLTIADASVSGLSVIGASVDQDKGTMILSLGAATLAGTYDVYGIEQPAVDLDIGGGLMPLALLATGDGGDTPSGTAPTLTEAQYDQLQLANDQKPRLSKTPEGRNLLSAYSTHNDDYHYVFQTNQALRQFWPADGATAEMADHTSDAVTNNTVVNPTGQTFGTGKVTYNLNSFTQAMHVAVACDAAGKSDAGSAVYTFMSGVTGKTDNSSSQTTEMTPDKVFTVVSTTTPPQLATDDGTHDAVKAAVASVAANSHDDSHIAAISSYGIDCDDTLIANIQAIHATGTARSQPATRVDLWTGPVSKALGAIDMMFELEDEPDGHVSCRLVSSTLGIESLDVETSGWVDGSGADSTAADIARDRIIGARFLHGLVQDRINTAIKQAVGKIVAEQTA